MIFSNPLYLENEKRGYSTYNVQEKLYFIKEDRNSYIMPKGFLSQLIEIFKYNNIPFKIKDLTQKLPEISFKFKGKLYDYQEEAVRKILSKRFGVLQSPTGSGKTNVVLAVIAQRKQPVLIVVHTKELLYQWKERAIEFLGLSENEIGLIGDNQYKIGSKLTIAIINSLRKHVHDIKDRIGFLVIDECHRLPLKNFYKSRERI